MDHEADLTAGSTTTRAQRALGRLAGRLIALVARSSPDPETLAEWLEGRFAAGLEIPHSHAGSWFATLETILPDDHQVATLIRLSRTAPHAPRRPVRQTPDFE